MTNEELFGILEPDYSPRSRLQASVPSDDAHIISVDDIIDLVIILNTTKSVDEFLGRI